MKRIFMNQRLANHLFGAFMLFVAACLTGCFEEPNEMAILDDDDVVIPLLNERIQDRENLSYFAAILKGARLNAEVVDEKTDIATPVVVNFWNTFSGYGTYTVFAPNNVAVKEWLSEKFPQIDQTSPETVQAGIEGLDSLSMVEVTNTIQYHICNDSIPTKLFVMGKFPYPTLLGSYLLLSKEQATYQGEEDAYTCFNKCAYLINKDINAGNGYLHIISKVLEPENRTIAHIIRDLDDNYSIFKSIFSDRTITEMDSLLDINYSYSKTLSGRTVKKNVKYTLFVHDDATFTKFFKDNGITSYANGREAMMTYLNNHRQSGDDRDNIELLKSWALYHTLSGEFYMNDLIKLCGANGTMVTTLATNETLGIKYLSEKLRFNRDDERAEDGSFDTGGKAIAELSDMGATNGVIHFIDKVFSMKVTKPKALFWDLADQAVISTHPYYRNKNGGELVGETDDYFPDFKITAKWGSAASVSYLSNAGWDNSKTCHVYGDRITVQIGSNRIKQLTITTPSLTKGKYYVWVCSRHQGSGTCKVVLTHNGVPNKKTSNFDYWGTKDNNDPINTGYKSFTAKSDYQMSCHVMGNIEVVSNGPQVMTLDFDTSAANGLGAWLDMIQFIPMDDNQAWPRFDACGIAYYENPSSIYTDPWNCPKAEAEDDDDEEPLPED